MQGRRSRHRRLLLGAILSVTIGLVATEGRAQAVERNLPSRQPSPDVPMVITDPKPQDDSTPIGPNLTMLIIDGGSDGVASSPGVAAGVDLRGAARLRGTEQEFKAFLGRPLSRKLISDIQARVLALYRAQGHPLINLSTPPQDITDGVLRILVLEFTVDAQTVSGVAGDEADYIASRVRMSSGEAVDTSRLTQDLEWLNRYPFRRVTVAFSPSERPGGTDVTLQGLSSRPWQVSAGYSNSGSPDAGVDRYFVAAQVGVPGVRDTVVSYQGTVSGDALSGNGLGDARYRSNAFRIMAPLRPRQAFELTLNAVETRQPFAVFMAETSILETTVTWRSAASNLWLGASGEVSLGIEAKQNLSTITFAGVPINEAQFDVYQLAGSYSWRGVGRLGVTQIGVIVHGSPGGINDNNTDAAFSAYSAGRFEYARYAYATAEFSNLSPTFKVLGLEGLQAFNSLMIQYSGKPLPATEQTGLGGTSAVRGYTLDDGAFDSIAVLRSELRFKSLSPLRDDDTLAPYLFADMGYGESRYYGQGQSAISIGLGVDYAVGRGVSLALDAVAPLQDLGTSRAGRARVEARLVVAF